MGVKRWVASGPAQPQGLTQSGGLTLPPTAPPCSGWGPEQAAAWSCWKEISRASSPSQTPLNSQI